MYHFEVVTPLALKPRKRRTSRPRTVDKLAAARGILTGLLIGLGLWLLIYFAAKQLILS
jgi:hypothetical protein